MLFNSIEFAVFLPIAFLLYWFVCGRSARWQNLLLLIASYVFYAFWDWRFLGLIVFTTLTTYASGLLIGKFRAQDLLQPVQDSPENPIGGVRTRPILTESPRSSVQRR